MTNAQIQGEGSEKKEREKHWPPKIRDSSD